MATQQFRKNSISSKELYLCWILNRRNEVPVTCICILLRLNVTEKFCQFITATPILSAEAKVTHAR